MALGVTDRSRVLLGCALRSGVLGLAGGRLEVSLSASQYNITPSSPSVSVWLINKPAYENRHDHSHPAGTPSPPSIAPPPTATAPYSRPPSPPPSAPLRSSTALPLYHSGPPPCHLTSLSPHFVVTLPVHSLDIHPPTAYAKTPCSGITDARSAPRLHTASPPRWLPALASATQNVWRLESLAVAGRSAHRQPGR